jgi:Secretion system C-terminal sorting domain
MKRFLSAISLSVMLFSVIEVKAQVPKLNSFPQATATIFLDFDGQTVTSSFWTANPFYATPAELTNDQIIRIFNQVSEDFRPFNLNITTDSTVFFATAPGRRQRIIITNYSQWYGNAGGVAYNPSFRWTLEVPGFVFSNLLATNPDPNVNAKRVAEACSHETGHTLGLDHQKTYNASCALTAEYNPGVGTGEIGWAPIMGNSYSRNLTLWHNGTSLNCDYFQNDLNVIGSTGEGTNSNNFGFRADDISNNTAQAANVQFNGSMFSTTGFINSTNDIDVFRFNFPQTGRFVLNAIPYNVSSGYQSANIDIQVALLGSNGNVIRTYNPSASVQAIIDSTIDQGTYFVRITNSGNANTTNYGMLGNYTLSGSFRAGATLPVYDLKLSARVANEKHELDWNIIADEPIDNITVEVSTDGTNFNALQDVNGSLRKFIYQPFDKSTLFYRLHVITASQLKYYSNIVSLRAVSGGKKYNLNTNFINSSSIVVNSKGNYNWRLMDMNGRMYGSGRLNNGSNRIEASNLSSGMYLLQVIDGSEITTEKIIKK